MATMSFSEAVQEIRREWRRIMPEITQPARQKVNGETSWICPKCGHGTHGDGLTMNPQSKDGNGLKCFGCGWAGDIIDLYREITGKEFAEAVRELAGMIGIIIEDSNTSPLYAQQGQFNQQAAPGSAGTHPAGKTQQEATEAPKPAQDFTAYYEACRATLDSPEGEPGRAYLAQRQVMGPAVAEDVGNAGYDAKERRIIIPVNSSFYIARAIDPQTEPRYKNPKGAPAAIFNESALYAQEVQEVFIAEGTFDALSIIEAGGQAIALNSAGNTGKLIDKLEQAPTKATLILCPDNDPDESTRAKVKKHFDNLAAVLDRLHIPFIMADINNGCKDANEALQKDRGAFKNAVYDAVVEAQAYKENLQQQAQQAEQDRRQRTGAGMVDAFLQAVQTERYKPVPTGITDIDKALTGGFTRQQLILLGAAPGAGKTALTQWIFEGMAKAGHTVLFLNLEMSREQILARSISRIAAQNGDHITPAEVKQGYNWNFAQRAIVTEAAEKYKREIAPHMIYNPDGVTADLDGILKYLEEEAGRAEAAGLPAPLVVLDYLQIITGREREDGTALIKRAVGSLKRFAIQHDTLVFCIIAHNRAANQSGTVTMESGRDTSALEYSADLQLGLAFTRCLYRPGQDRKEADALTPEERRFVTLKITKGRDARIGAEVDLLFNGETMTYTQLAPAYMEEPTQQVKPIRI